MRLASLHRGRPVHPQRQHRLDPGGIEVSSREDAKCPPARLDVNGIPAPEARKTWRAYQSPVLCCGHYRMLSGVSLAQSRACSKYSRQCRPKPSNTFVRREAGGNIPIFESKSVVAFFSCPFLLSIVNPSSSNTMAHMVGYLYST